MPSTATDRIDGISTSEAVKVSCRLISLGNITLSGLQTIDGVLTVAGDRILVAGQTNAVQNGIYLASALSWTREPDFDGARDATTGTLVFVFAGSTKAATWWAVTTLMPFVIAQDAVNFQQTTQAFIAVQATETTAGIAEIATQAEVTAGTDDTTIITPKKLAASRLMNEIYLSAAGVSNYVKDPKAVFVEVEGCGGGGGGGGCATTSASQVAAGGGGAGAGYARKIFAAASLAASISVTVGAAGAAGAAGANNGGNGGASSFGALLTMPGGAGGGGSAAIANTGFGVAGTGAAPGVGTLGDLNLSGGGGAPGIVLGSSAPVSGIGGATFFGPGGSTSINGAGVNAVNPGSGGSGASNASSAAARAGGIGAVGLVIIREYA